MAENKLTLESLAAEVAALTKTVASLSKAVKESTVQHEEEAVAETPVDLSTLGFTADKVKYSFSRPSVTVIEGGKAVTYKAKEVSEDETLQSKFAAMAQNGETTFVVASK